MSFNDISLNFIIGLVSGLVSGLISGFGVAIYYRKRDKKEQWLKELHDDKQTMSNYINNVRNEIDFLIYESADKTYLKRLLHDPPRFPSFIVEKIKPEHHSFTKNAYELFNDIEAYLGNNVELKINDLKIF